MVGLGETNLRLLRVSGHRASADSVAHVVTTGALRRPASGARRRVVRLSANARSDLGVGLVYLALAAWIGHGLWPSPATRALAHNVGDQTLIEWFLAHGVLFWTGELDLHTVRLNSPDGVNLMSNASHLLHGILMAPVTVLFGASVSFALLVPLNLAATATGWYLLFARGLRRDRLAAMVGGLVTGFAPGMIAQSNSHLHISAQWLVPPIVWCVIQLARARTGRAAVTASLGLAALVCAQVFLGEEVLYLTALTLLLFTLAYAATRPRWARRVAPTFLSGLALAASVSALALVYPLWMQFAGPQHIPNAPFAAQYFYADVFSYLTFSPLSIAGSPGAGRLASSPAELNAFLGAPLLVLLVALVVWRRRTPSVVAAAVAMVVLAYLSLGVTVTVDGEPTGFPSLYRLIADIPVIDAALPTRYALALIPLIAVVLVDAIEAARAGSMATLREAMRLGGPARPNAWAQAAVPLAVAAALLPLFPLPLAATDRDPVPAFITSGAWRQCVPEGGVLVPVPLPTPYEPDTMRWAAAANAAFGIPEGFFLGPYGPNGRTSVGTWKQPTSALLADVAATGQVPVITDEMRAQARADLEFWRADCVALAHVRHGAALRSTLEQLLGPGTPIVDTWTWRVTR
jgi:hypothetical protein